MFILFDFVFSTYNTILLDGINYPAGTTLAVSIYNAHHNPKNFKDPESFMPERHNVVRSVENNNAYNFIPFAPGVRACKGNYYFNIYYFVSKI